MKLVMKNKNMMMIALFTVLTFGSVNSVSANTNIEEPVEIKYLGTVRNQPVFQLNFNMNDEKSEFLVTIKDENGVELYSEKIKGGKVTRKYRIDTDEVSFSGIQFEVINRSTFESTVYKINATTRTLQDVTIAKS